MMTALIVDDHGPFRAQARALLEDDGYEVVGEAADARSGLAAARAFRPGLVLLDIQLPDGNGFDVAEMLAEEVPDARVILISGRESRDYRRKLARTGATFLPKSRLTAESLAAILDEAG